MTQNKPIVFVWLMILLGMFFLAGCGQTTTVDPDELSIVEGTSVVSEVVEEVDEGIDPGTEEFIDDELGEDEAPDDMEADQPQEPNYCLECHNDQQMLIDNAAPVEAVVSESEGEG